MKTIKAIFYFILFGLFFNTTYSQQTENKDFNKEIDNLLSDHPKSACKVPVYNTFSGDVENVNNVSEAKNIDMEVNQGGITYINGDVYFSPQNIVKLLRKELKDDIGLIF